MKEPYVYANLQLYYKDYPKEYLGATGEYWTMGKRKPEKLSVLLADLIRTTVVFYLNCKGNVSPGEINEELDKVIDLIKLTKIKKEIIYQGPEGWVSSDGSQSMPDQPQQEE